MKKLMDKIVEELGPDVELHIGSDGEIRLSVWEYSELFNNNIWMENYDEIFNSLKELKKRFNYNKNL